MPSVIDTLGGADHGYALIAPGVGLKAGLHQSGPAVDPDEPECARRRESLSARRTGCGAASPERESLPAARRASTRDACGDEFLLERRGRVVVGSPCSGHGFKFAPVIGRRLAALAEEAF